MFRLRNKIFLCALGSIAPLGLVLSALGIYSFKHQMEEAFHLRTLAVTRTLLQASSEALKDNRKDTIQPLLDSLLGDPDLEEVRVLDRSGQPIASKVRGASAVATFRVDPTALDEALRAYTPDFRTIEVSGRRSIVVYQRLWSETPDGIETLGVGYVRFSAYRLDRKIETMTFMACSVVGASIVLALVLSYLLSAIVLRPIEDLRRAAEAVGRGDFGASMSVTSRDEIGELARAFEHMSKEVQSAALLLESKVQERTRQLEESRASLVRSEKMASVGQLAAGLALEINTPLGAMLGTLEGALGEIPAGTPLEVRLKAIQRETNRCRDLVGTLLSFSRASRPERKEEVDIQNTVQDALSLVTAPEATKRVTVKREFEAGLPKVQGSRNQIEQIVIRLCDNALNAMPGAGTLTVRLRRAQENGASYVALAVADTGDGIPKEIQSRIFDPYFATQEAGKGTGLDLSIVYELVQWQGGKLSFSSEQGRGTEFLIFFPSGPETVAAS